MTRTNPFTSTKIAHVIAPDWFPTDMVRIWEDQIVQALYDKYNAAAEFDRCHTGEAWAAERAAASRLGKVVTAARNVGFLVEYPIN